MDTVTHTGAEDAVPRNGVDVLTDHQLHWRNVARSFADEVVRPVAAELDAKVDPAESFSWEIVEEADRRNLRCVPLPEEMGGAGTDAVANSVMLEEIAAADMGVSVVLAQTWKFIQLLQELGTEDQCDRWLSRLAANPRGLLAASFTEPVAGSDNVLPYAGADGGLRTRAVKVGGGWVLNGEKRYISNSNRSDFILCFARTTDDQPVAESVTLFIVDSKAEGVSFGKIHDKIGERLANNSEIFYKDVFVPDEDLLGEPDTAMSNVARLLRASNAYAAACTLGVAREAFDRAIEHCRIRVQGGKPIIDHEIIRVELADMYVSLDLARTYIRRAAAASDRQDLPFDPKLAVIPKLAASQIAFDVTRRALEMFGGAGVMREVGMEKLLRDATIFLHSDGTNGIMRKKVGADLAANGNRRTLWQS